MEAYRAYGSPPFSVALVHGGPGAPGDLAPVARELSRERGILEPLQRVDSIDGQVEELVQILHERARLPVTLVGHSWGAWLAVIAAARYPDIAARLILVGAGPFDEIWVPAMDEARRARLGAAGLARVAALQRAMGEEHRSDALALFAEFGEIMTGADSFDLLPPEGDAARFEVRIFERVMPQARELRRSGELMRLAARLTMPVLAIHGDHDSHPGAGVREPLSRVLRDFRYLPLPECGHYPWRERRARDAFYAILRRELA